jgi:hypothetical protein
MAENFYQAVTGKPKFVRLFWGKTNYCVWSNNEKSNINVTKVSVKASSLKP